MYTYSIIYLQELNARENVTSVMRLTLAMKIDKMRLISTVFFSTPSHYLVFLCVFLFKQVLQKQVGDIVFIKR